MDIRTMGTSDGVVVLNGGVVESGRMKMEENLLWIVTSVERRWMKGREKRRTLRRGSTSDRRTGMGCVEGLGVGEAMMFLDLESLWMWMAQLLVTSSPLLLPALLVKPLLPPLN